ncbi:XRE family transcriptional regulator [Oligella urethralis]|nr:XRE family transcriptional regulator [Oligella urethralis]
MRNKQGEPEYVVLPYEDYLQLIQQPKINLEHGVPSQVVDLIFDKGYSPAKAWREYLGVTQAQAAENIGISQSAYSQLENSTTPTLSARAKIAKALNINPEQLDC